MKNIIRRINKRITEVANRMNTAIERLLKKETADRYLSIMLARLLSGSDVYGLTIDDVNGDLWAVHYDEYGQKKLNIVTAYKNYTPEQIAEYIITQRAYNI